MRKTFILLTIMTLLASPVMSQIDLHSHAITQGYLDYIKANVAEMDEGFPIPGWDVEKHIAFMDKAGIQTSVLTMPTCRASTTTWPARPPMRSSTRSSPSLRPTISSTVVTTRMWPSRCSSAASRPWRSVSPRTD